MAGLARLCISGPRVRTVEPSKTARQGPDFWVEALTTRCFGGLLRSEAELIRASNAYATEDISKTWRLALTTMAVHGAAVGVVLLSDNIWADILGSVVAGLVSIRAFIFYHDYCHGAIFRKSKAGKALMTLVGYYCMAVPSVWRETHNYHHRNNAKLVGSGIGSYPTVSLGIYRSLKESDRHKLKAIRHPATVVLGIFTTFLIGMCYAPFRRDPKKHWQAPFSGVVWWAVLAGLGLAFGARNAFFAMFLPTFIHSAMGSYLFYAQHNFPDAELRGRRSWEFGHAALKASSFFDMAPIMHWFTGNIGYHHVHHLNSRIPFYRLPEAMREIPELQNPGRTTWALSDIKACFACSVWDEASGRFLSFAEADAHVAGVMAEAAK